MHKFNFLGCIMDNGKYNSEIQRYIEKCFSETVKVLRDWMIKWRNEFWIVAMSPFIYGNEIWTILSQMKKLEAADMVILLNAENDIDKACGISK